MAATALITTTINIPVFLRDYAKDATSHGREVKFYVAGDKKTPPGTAQFCRDIERDFAVTCEYLGVAEQNALMRAYPRLAAHLPWNCVQRRNVAVLKAAADGSDVVITIDDDNFLEEPDFFGLHDVCGSEAELDECGEAGYWFNVCRFLTERDGRKFFARGYSMRERGHGEQPATVIKAKKPVAVNAGLWLGDPDIDAITRMAAPPEVTGYAREDNFFVGNRAWTPFNSQNTALARRVLPAYFLSPHVGRFDDIFASFIVKRIADHLGEGVAFGRPLVRQTRNQHDAWEDLDLERMGCRLCDEFVDALADVTLPDKGWGDCAAVICDELEARLQDSRTPTDAERVKLAAFFAGYRLWTATIKV